MATTDHSSKSSKQSLYAALKLPQATGISNFSKLSEFGVIKLLALTGAWALFTGQPDSAQKNRYFFPVPDRLEVKSTTLPYQTESRPIGNPKDGKIKLVKIIETKNVDFSKDFELETDRYKIIKHEDWLPSKCIGHIFSVFSKAFYWDTRFGLGFDGDGTKNIIGMLERDKSVDGLTVRINHTEAWEDTWRALKDERAAERNGLLARLIIGMPETLTFELFAELRRGDYYNPMTGTVVYTLMLQRLRHMKLGTTKIMQDLILIGFMRLSEGFQG